MRKLSASVLVCAVVVTGLGAWHLLAARTAPSISVWIEDDTGGGGGPGVPAVDNYVSGGSGTSGTYTHDGNFRVASSSPGKFFVLAHYRVEHDGTVSNFDVSLPVQAQKPARDNWIKLNDHLSAVAFYDGGTISY